MDFIVHGVAKSQTGLSDFHFQGAKTSHASQPKIQNIRQKQYCNKFNEVFKNGPRQKKKKNLLKKRLRDRISNLPRSYSP